MNRLGDRLASLGTGVRLGLFAAALAVSFGTAAAVGAAVGPIDVGGDPGQEMPHVEPHDTTVHDAEGGTNHVDD